MQKPDTKGRILIAARSLFEEGGLAGFSVRAVTARAGTNVAAVNYHFGSKAALLRAIVRSAFDEVAAEQARLLTDLEKNKEEEVPSVGEILAAYSAPVFALFDADRAGEWGYAWMQARGAAERERPPMMFAETRVTRRYQEALRRALPHVPPDELWWRFERATNLLMANQGRRASEGRLPEGGLGVEEERRWLLTFFSGALSAPESGA